MGQESLQDDLGGAGNDAEVFAAGHVAVDGEDNDEDGVFLVESEDAGVVVFEAGVSALGIESGAVGDDRGEEGAVGVRGASHEVEHVFAGGRINNGAVPEEVKQAGGVVGGHGVGLFEVVAGSGSEPLDVASVEADVVIEGFVGGPESGQAEILEVPCDFEAFVGEGVPGLAFQGFAEACVGQAIEDTVCGLVVRGSDHEPEVALHVAIKFEPAAAVQVVGVSHVTHFDDTGGIDGLVAAVGAHARVVGIAAVDDGDVDFSGRDMALAFLLDGGARGLRRQQVEIPNRPGLLDCAAGALGRNHSPAEIAMGCRGNAAGQQQSRDQEEKPGRPGGSLAMNSHDEHPFESSGIGFDERSDAREPGKAGPSGALQILGLVPEFVHLFERHGGEVLVVLVDAYFDMAEPADKLVDGSLKRLLGMNVEEPADVDEGEKQVSKFLGDFLGVGLVGGFAEFTNFFLDLFPNVVDAVPVESDACGFFLDAGSACEGGEGARNAVENRGDRGFLDDAVVFLGGEAVGFLLAGFGFGLGLFLGALDLFPVLEHFPGPADAHVAEDVGVASNELGTDVGEDVVDGESAVAALKGGVKDHLEGQVAEFFPEAVHVVVVDGFADLVSFLDDVGFQGFVGLLAIPGASVGFEEALHNGDETAEGIGIGWGGARGHEMGFRRVVFSMESTGGEAPDDSRATAWGRGRREALAGG